MDDPIAELNDRLPRHGRLLQAMRDVVEDDDRLRWLTLGCSLGVAGGGDELSDIDAGIGYRDIDSSELVATAEATANLLGDPIDVIVHRMPGWPDEVCRVATEYHDGVQLDLVFTPEHRRDGLPPRERSVVDKDGRLAHPMESREHEPPAPQVVRECVFLGWWALAAADKYVVRRSWFEAVEALAEARRHTLSLYACGQSVPHPEFGLVSLLDFPPFELPGRLDEVYCTPADPAGVIAGLRACADLLRDATSRAADRVGTDIDSAMAEATSRKLARH